jgi:hypothetical protein
MSRDQVGQLQVLPISDDHPYINNFIFIPPERSDILQKLRV